MSTLVVTDEHALYPIHEEDTVVQGPIHDRQCRYLTGALQAHRRDLWVVHDVCHYWERGNFTRYRAPDVSVIDCPPPADPPNVYLAWQDPPLLFIGEVASDTTREADLGEKKEDYAQHLQAPEYLFCDPFHHERRLWRLEGGVYRPVRPDRLGRVWSAVLELGFGYDETGFLRIYTRDGSMLLTHEEERQQREEEAARRAEAERRIAELTAELERLRQSENGSS
jgi:Uma2 family endonuclease